MPLHILGPLVVVGVLGITVLLHLLGMSARVRFDSSSARQAWLRHFPDDPVREVLLSPDGHCALILAGSGPGLVFAMGADSTAKYLRGAKLRPQQDGLLVRMRDVGAPGLRIAMPLPDQDTWIKAIGPL